MKQKTAVINGWQPGQRLNHLHQVWEYIERRIPEIKQRLQRISQKYYDHRRDTSFYDMEICELFKEGEYSSDIVYQVIAGATKAVDVNLLAWIEKITHIQPDLDEIYTCIKEDIVLMLMQYCSDYRAVGMDDSRLFTLFRSKMISISKILASSHNLIHFLRINSLPVHLDGVPSERLQCECEAGHIVTKLVPVTVNFLEEVLELSHHWVISDKLYVEEVYDAWKRSKDQLSELEKQSKLAKRIYNTARSTLQEDLTVLETLQKELRSFESKEISAAQKELYQVKLEITALKKTLESIRSELTDLDVPDCCAVEILDGGENDDVVYYQRILDGKRQRWKYLTDYLDDYQNLKKQLHESKKQADHSKSRHNKAKRKYAKLIAQRDACSDKVLTINEIYSSRVYPVHRGHVDTL